MLDTAEPPSAPFVPHRRDRRPAWSPTLSVRASMWLHAAAAGGLLADPSAWQAWIGVVLANHCLLGAVGMWPKSRLLGPNLVRLPEAGGRARGLVVLSFDDGPDPEVTPLVLDLLERHGASASFFCVGKRARAYPDLVRDIARRGHSVENHTERHKLHFACLGLGGVRREIDEAQATLIRITGRAPRFFRAPAGLRSPLLDPVLSRTGLRYTSWTRRGYDTVYRTPAAVLRHLTRGLRAGDIILLHDGAYARTRAGRPVVLEVLPDLLDHLRGLGLRAVSLPGAFAHTDTTDELT